MQCDYVTHVANDFHSIKICHCCILAGTGCISMCYVICIMCYIAQFNRSAKVSNAFFRVVILTSAMLTLGVFMLTLVC